MQGSNSQASRLRLQTLRLHGKECKNCLWGEEKGAVSKLMWQREELEKIELQNEREIRNQTPTTTPDVKRQGERYFP